VSGVSPPPSLDGRILLAVAAPAEARAVLAGLGESPNEDAPSWRLRACAGPFDVVETGVGKGCAAGGVARCFDAARHRAVLSLGVGGALPRSGLRIGDVVLATESVYADEGALTPSGFIDVGAMGFAPDPASASVGVRADAALAASLRPLADRTGVVATVSTCSGADDLAVEIVRRTGAVAEAMEGAAVGFACRRLGAIPGAALAFAEVRVISNTTGDRPKQVWDLPAALRRLQAVSAELRRLLA
jgi:futalosine hydrolase